MTLQHFLAASAIGSAFVAGYAFCRMRQLQSEKDALIASPPHTTLSAADLDIGPCGGSASPPTSPADYNHAAHPDHSLPMRLARARRAALPKRVILIRHGESEGNADHTLYRTKADNLIELTEKGSQQALQAGRRLASLLGPDERVHFYVSPFQRALQTSRNIQSCLRRSQYVTRTSVDPRIREQEFGNLQGEEFRHLRNQQQDVGRFWFRFPQGESGADVYDRVKQWWDSTVMSLNCRPGLPTSDTVVVVTHGLTMRLILMQLYGWSPNTFLTVWNAGNCDMYVLSKQSHDNEGEEESEIHLPETAIVRSRSPSGCGSDETGSCQAPFALNAVEGDMPDSSLPIIVTTTDGTQHSLTLSNYLSLPAPRTTNMNAIRNMVSEQHGISSDDISNIDMYNGRFGKYM